VLEINCKELPGATFKRQLTMQKHGIKTIPKAGKNAMFDWLNFYAQIFGSSATENAKPQRIHDDRTAGGHRQQ
jgi:hypothetical protein